MKEFPSYKEIGYEIGQKLPKQKKFFVGEPNGPKTPNEVLHLVDVDQLNNIEKKQDLVNGVLEGLKDSGESAGDVKFLNYKGTIDDE